MNGGIYTQMYWIGQVLLGSVIPLILLYTPSLAKNRNLIGVASVLIILGGLATLYVIVIGGQTYPMTLVPGYEASSSFFDGVIAEYTPSKWELMLGLGGVSVSLLIVFASLKLFRLLPISLSEEVASTLKP